jgi:hypothetical protein
MDDGPGVAAGDHRLLEDVRSLVNQDNRLPNPWAASAG